MLKTNDNGLIYLDKAIMNAIFDCVYDFDEKGHGLKHETRKLMKNEQFKYYIQMLKAAQEYNYRYRFEATSELFPIFEATVGPMERNSEGTTLCLAMGLALKELYGFRRETLKSLLKTMNI
jgi:hypothetical protein